MTPFRIGLVLFGLTCVVLWMVGGLLYLGLALVVGAIGYVYARELEYFLPDESSARALTGPRLPFVASESIGISDELADLLKSATEVASRSLEERGRFDPFVIYEDLGGTLRMRPVAASTQGRPVYAGVSDYRLRVL